MIVEYLFEKIRNCFLPLALFIVLAELFFFFENEWLVGQTPLFRFMHKFCIFVSIFLSGLLAH